MLIKDIEEWESGAATALKSPRTTVTAIIQKPRSCSCCYFCSPCDGLSILQAELVTAHTCRVCHK